MARRQWTRDEVKYLKSVWGTLRLDEICEELNRSYASIKCKVYKLGLDFMAKPQKEFALYKGEQMIAIGTVREIAEERGVKPETIRFYKSETYQRRAKSETNNRLKLIRIDD